MVEKTHEMESISALEAFKDIRKS